MAKKVSKVIAEHVGDAARQLEAKKAGDYMQAAFTKVCGGTGLDFSLKGNADGHYRLYLNGERADVNPGATGPLGCKPKTLAAAVKLITGAKQRLVADVRKNAETILAAMDAKKPAKDKTAGDAESE